MEIIRANVLGMCFGVRDALTAIAAVPDPTRVTIHGQLVHNEVVLHQLSVRGFASRDEIDRATPPETPVVLITAHGVSDRERARLVAAGKELVDTTCPLVRRVHLAAQKLQRDGFHVLVIGRPGHVEVEGIVGDLTSFDVVPNVAAVRNYPHAKLGIICQSTTTTRAALEVRIEVERLNPDAQVKFIDTTCQPTRDHQKALDELLPTVDIVVVVGGSNSNNTRELVALAASRGLPAYHVRGPEDLRPSWFTNVNRVGLTAGTSTLDETVQEVQEAIEQFAQEITARSELIAPPIR